MRGKIRRRRDANALREDALRPCATLGYDRDSLAMHLISCGALEIAEQQLRRAIWLNPFEPAFRRHLALCLRRQGRHAEAGPAYYTNARAKGTSNV